MSDMIERVAKALKSAMQDSGAVSLVANGPNGEAALEQFLEVLAMDAIEAMREPTSEMIAEGHRHDPLSCDVGEDQVEYCYGTMWRAMIDAALNEKNPATP